VVAVCLDSKGEYAFTGAVDSKVFKINLGNKRIIQQYDLSVNENNLECRNIFFVVSGCDSYLFVGESSGILHQIGIGENQKTYRREYRCAYNYMSSMTIGYAGEDIYIGTKDGIVEHWQITNR
jgi:hypothetical protein